MTTGIRSESDAYQRLGVTLLTTLVRCLKIAWMHQLDNAALHQVARQVVALLNPELQHGVRVELQFVHDKVFVNGQVLKLTPEAFESAQGLHEICDRLGINEIAFLEPLTDADFRGFLAVFQRHVTSQTPKAFLGERLHKVAVRAIQGAATVSAVPVSLDERGGVGRTYGAVVVTLRQVVESIRTGRPPRVDRLRRALQQLVDVSPGSQAVLLGLTRLDNPHGDAALHATAVAVLTLVMARGLDVPRGALMELCLAALFHDLGRVDLKDMGQVSERTVEHYASALARVPLASALLAGKTPIYPECLLRMTTAHDVTLASDGSVAGTSPEHAARLVAVACAFDLLTSPPAPRRGMLPDQALKVILDRGGKRFDALAARHLAATLGRYPVGSLVRLTDGRTGVVVFPPPSARTADRPVVRVLGEPAEAALDLSDAGQAARIACCLCARSHRVNVVASFLG